MAKVAQKWPKIMFFAPGYPTHLQLPGMTCTTFKYELCLL